MYLCVQLISSYYRYSFVYVFIPVTIFSCFPVFCFQRVTSHELVNLLRLNAHVAPIVANSFVDSYFCLFISFSVSRADGPDLCYKFASSYNIFFILRINFIQEVLDNPNSLYNVIISILLQIILKKKICHVFKLYIRDRKQCILFWIDAGVISI